MLQMFRLVLERRRDNTALNTGEQVKWQPSQEGNGDLIRNVIVAVTVGTLTLVQKSSDQPEF